MPVITFYFDHYRGFEKTFLPLRDASFFLGENSTGKTSVLAAIQILSDLRFWLSGELRHDHIDLGSFRDITSPRQKAFKLGFFWEHMPQRLPYAALLTFTREGSMPALSSIRMLHGGIAVHLERHEGGVRMKRTLPQFEKKLYTVERIFRSWLKKERDPSGWSEAAGGIPLPVLAPASLKLQADWAKNIPAPPTALLPVMEAPVWIAPIRAKPRRTYDTLGLEYSPEGEHTPHLLQKLLSSRSSAARGRFRQYGSESGLFRDVDVHRFGNEERSPFSVDVDLGELKTSIYNVGYGVSQALPIIAEVITRTKKSWFSIQQPEVHLHPRAQAALGGLFFDMIRRPQEKRFLVETHSDFIVDRFRYRMRKASEAGEPVPSAQVVFFRRDGFKNVLFPLVFSPRGEYPEEQPPEFRDFFLQEELKNLGF